MAFAVPLLALFGCQAAPDPIVDSPIIVIETLDSAQPARASDIYPPRAGESRYHITGGDFGGTMLVRETSETDSYQAQWITVESIIEADGPAARSTTFWSISDEGDALLHASIDHQQNALTLFNPPLVMTPTELTAGATSESTTPMRVVSESNPAHKRENGDATQTIIHAGGVRLRTAIGELDAVKIIIDFTADLTMADAVERTELYVNPEHGIVAEKRSRRVDILGVGGSTEEEQLTIAGDN